MHARTAVDSARSTEDALGLSDRVLRSLAADVDLNGASAGAFSGSQSVVLFSSWCRTPWGSLEICAATLAVEGGLIVSTPYSTMRVPTSLPVERLIYLADAHAGGRWTSEWPPSQSVPKAVGVIGRSGSRSDTLIVRMGRQW